MAAPQEGIGEDEFQVAAVQSTSQERLNVTKLLYAPPSERQATSFGVEQLLDRDLKEIIQYLLAKELPKCQERARCIVLQSLLYSLIDNVLYLTGPKKRGFGQVVVPQHYEISYWRRITMVPWEPTFLAIDCTKLWLPRGGGMVCTRTPTSSLKTALSVQSYRVEEE